MLAFRAWAIGTLINVALITTELLLATPDMGSAVAVGLYAFAVAIFAPMQFIFSRRVPKLQVEDLAVTRLSRAGLIVTGLAVIAVIVLAAAGGVRLG